jgi:hypothetical protein
MLRTTLLSLSAAGAAALALAPAAQAKTNVDFNIGLGFDGGYVQVGNGDYYDDDYVVADEECHYVKVKHKKVKNGKVKVWYSKELVCY